LQQSSGKSLGKCNRELPIVNREIWSLQLPTPYCQLPEYKD
jgi:hypothetical protein